MRNLRTVLTITLLILCGAASARAQARLLAGTGKSDITPPIGTPLAGYGARLGKPSTGVHDPTEARALILDNGAEKIAFLSVDHLGFDHAMVERIRDLVYKATAIAPDHLFVMSSHTHSGGGAYLEPFPILAGRYDPGVRDAYSEHAARAVIAANQHMRAARIAFGAGEARGISRFRSTWPPNGPIDPEVGVIRVDAADTGKPMAVLMNFAAHPTVVGDKNFEFSADYVYYARRALEQMIGGEVMAIFANGAQGTVAPRAFQGKDEFQRAENVGTLLAAEVFKVTLMVTPQDSLDIRLVRHTFQAQTVPPPRAPVKITLPPSYDTEVCGISFDNRIAFVTIPGELSSILNFQVKERGHLLGFEKTFVLGLTNDALGYIITEDEYRHGTYESSISLFGPAWGSFITNEAFQALEKLRPKAELTR
jgi:Neutral/alkaline non-lysosomal ceramidase, N-terminal